MNPIVHTLIPLAMTFGGGFLIAWSVAYRVGYARGYREAINGFGGLRRFFAEEIRGAGE